MNNEMNSMPSPEFDSGTGYIKVRVTTARGAIPLEGASVAIRKNEPEDSSIIAAARTDRSGATETLALPTKPRSLSSAPSDIKPYTTYNIDVRMDGYYSQIYQNVPVFDGITAIQEAELIPLMDNGVPDNFIADDQRFFESQSPEL